MEDEDEQRALEEDITGKILWVSWCGILSEVQQLLPEVVSYIRRERDSMALEVRGRFRGCLLEMGNIIKKTSPVYLDDDLAHLRRIMLDAGAGISKHRSWLDARAAEQNKWSSTPASRGNPPTISAHFTENHIVDKY
ncbi:hypothetical protein BKA82DRAFT_239052 [Pisolithus tinctorius]|uniref:Uncharacterized protein n=1 Tax=Pisolithus tinctorius Marx 270 TaxID=870435 RepID=A0A0C3N695_PISTI|nr:hypothetical protein BKA82DRAFT_239052 [Pisolithus tinctorius]KIN96589.1 hypothetical protein M404DRAFT_239052 [Pisolithus tinctorius Marx 270]